MKSILFIVIAIVVICVAYVLILLKIRSFRKKQDILNEIQAEEFLRNLVIHGIPVENDPTNPVAQYYDPEKDN